MSKLYTTRTAALKATTIDGNIIDANRLMIYPGGTDRNERKNILDVIGDAAAAVKIDIYDERGNNVTENDIWGRSVEKIDGENIIRCKWLNANIPADVKSTITQVAHNKALNTNNALVLNIECDRIKSAIGTFDSPALLSFSGDLSNLEDGTSMFNGSAIQSVNFTLSSLRNGDRMFANCPIDSFNGDMKLLSYAKDMFRETTKMESFAANLDNLYDAESMFENSALSSFSAHIPYLYKATNMFANSNVTDVLASFDNLLDGSGMFENTNLTLESVRMIAETLPKINAYKLEEDGSKTYAWTNGLNYTYYVTEWSDEKEDTVAVSKQIEVSPDNIGEIMITWKDTSVLSKEEKAIIIYEYFKLMTLKGWTVVTNLYEDKTDDDENPIVPAGVFYRIANGHTYVATNIHYPEVGIKNETKWIHVDSEENIPANTIA